jgi:hypothetical protein
LSHRICFFPGKTSRILFILSPTLQALRWRH